MLKKHGFSPVYKETGGGHTWINWREYLNEFAPQLLGQGHCRKRLPAFTVAHAFSSVRNRGNPQSIRS
ncbi:MAG: hypothetical protein QUT30_02965 [Acidobacteriota bacterium]|nr:hypothetical protein [Acidobacteriota bacterium]